jgi:hypothetical protein
MMNMMKNLFILKIMMVMNVVLKVNILKQNKRNYDRKNKRKNHFCKYKRGR